MICLSVLYPLVENSPFNWDYYTQQHLPMVSQCLGSAVKAVHVQKGLAGGSPDSLPIYAAMAYIHFESLESFQTAFAPHADAILADIPNYSSVGPVVQMSEIVFA